ncbi:MAG: nickel-dependent hydrogenase large subunit [Actinobacteria bacterium]|nr:nickel-dependent hydrogenase large subunit [Actinomycetota bacterium]
MSYFIPDPAAALPKADQKDKKKRQDARKLAPGWKRPTTKAARLAEQQERIAAFIESGGTWPT